MGIEVLPVLQKAGGGVNVSPKKGEVGKLVEGGYWGWLLWYLDYEYCYEYYDYYAYLCVYKSKKHYNLRYIQE